MSDQTGVLSENSKVQEDNHPNIFISYSWSSEQIVDDVAQCLMSDGVNVILDKWDLKEGQNKYAFMERCVTDPKVIKVLIFCDKQYAQKANKKIGGVGDETAIISPEVYGKAEQDKFIPVIVEKDENGDPCLPAYLKSLMYIDLSNEDTYEQEQKYERLLRIIYNKPLKTKPPLGKMPEWLDEEKSDYKPLRTKPPLGKMPEWLDEEKSDYFLIRNTIKQIKGSATNAKRKSYINSFINEFLEKLKGFYIKDVDAKGAYDNFLKTKQVRDFFLDFVAALAETDEDYANILTDIFEKLYNKLTCIRTFHSESIFHESDLDVFRNFIWEVFICVIAYMRYIEDYKSINTMITHTYFLETYVLGGQERPTDYTEFRYHSRIIEEWYKPTTERKGLYTLRGEVICNNSEREKLPIYSKSSIAGADLFLYQVRNAFTLAGDKNGWRSSRWFPSFYVYAQYWNAPMEWSRMKSKKYCKKMFDLFGVSSIDELKAVLKKCTFEKDMRYNGGCDSAPAIENYINIEEIGIYN